MEDEIQKSLEYERQMAIESLFVGTGNVASFLLIQKLFPKWNAVGQVFLAGVVFHLTAEFSGLNNYYLDKGAATYYHRQAEPEYILIPEKSHKCHRPSFTGHSSYSSWEEQSEGLTSCLIYDE
jgi:hypothetical protein